MFQKQRKLSYNFCQSFFQLAVLKHNRTWMSFYTGSFNYLLMRHFSFGARGTPDMQVQNLVTLSEKLFYFVFSLLVSLLRVLVLSKRALSFWFNTLRVCPFMCKIKVQQLIKVALQNVLVQKHALLARRYWMGYTLGIFWTHKLKKRNFSCNMTNTAVD